MAQPDEATNSETNLVNALDSENTEASEYVDAVMSSQRFTKVNTPKPTRKRNASESVHTETSKSEVKKARTNQRAKKVINKAKRTLSSVTTATPTSVPPSENIVVSQADVHVDGNPSVEQLISKLSADMHMLFYSLQERMNKLESGLEQRISSKVSQILDRRLKNEMGHIQTTVDGKISDLNGKVEQQLKSHKDSLQTELVTELNVLHDRQEKLENAIMNGSDVSKGDIALNIIIRNLPEHKNENVNKRVHSIIRDGLKLKDISVSSVVRKNPTDNRPGLVIARLNSHEDKRKVMSLKRNLREHRQFSSVYIEHDQSASERVLSSNFRNIISAMKHSGLVMKGSRIVRSDARDRHSYEHGGQRPSDNTRHSWGEPARHRRRSRSSSGTRSGHRHVRRDENKRQTPHVRGASGSDNNGLSNRSTSHGTHADGQDRTRYSNLKDRQDSEAGQANRYRSGTGSSHSLQNRTQ